MRPEFVGALIALISSLLAIIVVTFFANRRMNKERDLQKIEQQRKERNDELMPRIKEAQISVDTINSEILQIVERFYIAKRAQNEDENTYKTTINMLRDQLVNFQSLNEMDQMLTVVHAIGDEDLINLAGEMNGVHNGLLGWIERLCLAIPMGSVLTWKIPKLLKLPDLTRCSITGNFTEGWKN